MLDVCLLGTGGMMPLPYRWLTALMVRYNGSSVLIDCGEGTQIAIKEKGWQLQADRCHLFYPLPWGSYQRASGASPYDGECRPDRAVDLSGAERPGAGSEFIAGHCA